MVVHGWKLRINGIDFEEITVDITKRQQFSPEFTGVYLFVSLSVYADSTTIVASPKATFKNKYMYVTHVISILHPLRLVRTERSMIIMFTISLLWHSLTKS